MSLPLGLPVRTTLLEALELTATAAHPEPLNDRLRGLAWRMDEAGITGITPSGLIAAATFHRLMEAAALHWNSTVAPGRLEVTASALSAAGVPVEQASAAIAGAYAGLQHANTVLLVTELVILSVELRNRALVPLRPVFEAPELAAAPCVRLLEALQDGPDTTGGDSAAARCDGLFELLSAPLREAPDSLEAQLAWMGARWTWLPEDLSGAIGLARDVLLEENRPRGEGGPGEVPVPTFDSPLDADVEAFSPDRDWMSNVVLMARSTWVWLDQLSRKYERPIQRLDQIPDDELDTLAARGFTGLWLIGLWERSPASAEIKRRMGNPDAVSSAYSLHDSQIAADLGGESAWRDLSERAGRRGIRLAADMVPNHVGITSRWVYERSPFLLSTDHPPYPGYRFTGPDLSHDDRVRVQLEDGYWDHSDAAVVFRREDRQTGDVRYVYHGNDGTQMPWNDTAQIDYLNPEAREAVIQEILGVARRFPIIRFDAAMTLARRHVRRLWYPEPGDGGAIPSRAERTVSRAEFDRLMPAEFWREVVDRVAAEVPDTLLLAEAFWMMEGYFVRTLGMHRVYNSAFMHMLKDEENAKYRQTIKNVLDHSPQILKRFVNFQNNPDEEPAAVQFGTGDKYFGVATLMATLPGLPMFGHGQLEGYREKYGMEYRRAYWDEQPDEELVARHDREIVPLLRRRFVFSEVEDFHLFDLQTANGSVDENVFAHSNRGEGSCALVLYNNRWERTSGRIVRSTRGDTLVDALGLSDARLIAMREQRSGLEFLREAESIRQEGLYVELDGYQSQVFLAVWPVTPDADWLDLATALAGRGVPSLNEAREDLRVTPQLDEIAAALGASDATPTVATVAKVLRQAPPDLARRHLQQVALTVLDDPDATLATLLASEPNVWALPPSVRAWLGVNEHEGVQWFVAEPMTALIEGWAQLEALALEPDATPADIASRRTTLEEAVERSGYRVDRLLMALDGGALTSD